MRRGYVASKAVQVFQQNAQPHGLALKQLVGVTQRGAGGEGVEQLQERVGRRPRRRKIAARPALGPGSEARFHAPRFEERPAAGGGHGKCEGQHFGQLCRRRIAHARGRLQQQVHRRRGRHAEMGRRGGRKQQLRRECDSERPDAHV
jgi:hypothetical protein